MRNEISALPREFRDLISDPVQLFVVARPSFDISRFDIFLSERGMNWIHSPNASDAELIVEASGRVCYMSFGANQHRKDTATYIQNLIDQGHESVLEHASWTFFLQGVSRAFTHQLVRHRVGFSFSQLSQQYYDQGNVQFVPPFELLKNRSLLADWARSMARCRTEYQSMITSLTAEKNNLYPDNMKSREISRATRSAARSILPNSTATQIMISANARALRNFISLRGNTHGDFEMSEVCVAILKLMKDEAPLLFSDFEVILEAGVERAVKR